MKSRVIFVVIVAFVVGAGAGGLGEHARLKHASDKAAAGPKTTMAVTANWYGSRATAACPALKRWEASVVAAIQAQAKKTPWASKRKALVAPFDAIGVAYRALLPLATPAGKVELELLIAHQKQVSAALRKSASAAAYSTTQKALTSPRVTHDIATVLQAEKRCSKS